MMKKGHPTLLVVDDDPLFLDSIKATLRKKYSVETCESPLVALQSLQKGQRFAVIISDMRMPGMSGVEFLRQASSLDKDAVRVMLTGHADLETAMSAVNEGGVSHFLTKPCPTSTLKEVVDSCVLRHAERTSPISGQVPAAFHRLVGGGGAMTRLKSMLHRLGQIDSTVLFTGESGTGKSLAAEVLHSLSTRKDKPFVRVNCPSLSRGVIEAELFGSVRGAYTGSVKDSIGRFMAADTGSILLDEIGDLSLELQAKLLQVIELKEFERIGDHKTRRVDVRVMAATNADLEQYVAQGRFRKDLFYRLNVMRLELPPLRERREDIPQLADALLQEIASRFSIQDLAIADESLRLLLQHAWPGNVRELKHTLEHGAALCAGAVIRPDDLPATLRSGGAAVRSPAGGALSERETLIAALEDAGWNKARAARALGISRSTLYRRMKDAGVHVDESMN